MSPSFFHCLLLGASTLNYNKQQSMPRAIKLASSGLPDEIYKPAPSYQPYNLSKNDFFYGQFAQDLVLWPILKNIPNGFFVESGAKDGEAHSNTLHYEKQGWSGLLIEPNRPVFTTLLSKHRRAHAYNGALSPTGSRTTARFSPRPDDLGQAYISPNGNDSWTNPRNPTPLNMSYEVKCESLMSLMAALNRTTVDFWSLDIEGAEGPVLESTDFNQIEVGVLLTEDNSSKTQEAMRTNGFKYIGCTRHTTVNGTIHDIKFLEDTTTWEKSGDSVYVNPHYFTKRGITVPTSVERSSGVETCHGVCREWIIY